MAKVLHPRRAPTIRHHKTAMELYFIVFPKIMQAILDLLLFLLVDLVVAEPILQGRCFFLILVFLLCLTVQWEPIRFIGGEARYPKVRCEFPQM